MKTNEQSVPARYFAILVDYLERNGTPCRDALSAAQVRSLNDPASLLTPTQVDMLLQEVTRLTGRTDLGFELGRLIKLNSHDILGYAIISCPTIDHIMRLTSRYYRLMTPMFTLRYQRTADQAELLFQPAQAMTESTLHFYLELLGLSLHVQLLAVTANRQPRYDLYLSMPEPPHGKRYRELTHVRVHFGASQLGVRAVLDTALFDQPLPMTDLRALAQAEARCKLMLQEMTAAGNWSDWVAMMLREAEDSQPTLEELARMLNISGRTLDRQLEKEGAGFRDLSLTIRNERACQMLIQGTQPVSQIAYRLGYTDVSNFSRSFKKHNGMTPSAYQAHQRSEVGDLTDAEAVPGDS